MKNRLGLVMFVLCLMYSLASAQVDRATGTVTNDATQARLRVNNCVFGGPNVDVLVNSDIATNGSLPQTNQGFWTSGYLFLAPGTHSVAIVPTGEGLEQALVGPLDVPMVAGHRYTLVVMGQADEPSHEALVIDETETYQAIGATPTDTPHITVNNLRGAAGVTFELDGIVREESVPYGGFEAALWPSGTFTGLDLTVRNAENEVIVSDGFTDEAWNGPGSDWLDCVGGVPGTVMQDWFNESSPSTSGLSALDFLKTFSSVEGRPFSFDTFLTALETTGLAEMLESSSPNLIFPPTDEAFAALPKGQLDALLADPEALADLLHYHIVEGYYPRGALTGEDGHAKVLTNMLGMELELLPGTINGVDVSDLQHNYVANGSRVVPITAVLIPPEQ